MTTVTDLLDEMDRQVPQTAAVGTCWQGQARVRVGPASHQLVVAARIDARGRRRAQYAVDGTRVERAVLLKLTCPEAACPQNQAVRAHWATFRGQVPGRPAARRLQAEPLMQEVPVVVGRHHCVARPQRFACLTPCPHHAHPPMVVDRTGFDLFEQGQYLGGGLTEHGGVCRPRLPSLAAAEAYVLARHLEALVAVETARGEATGGAAGRP